MKTLVCKQISDEVDGNVRVNLHDGVSFLSLVVTPAEAKSYTYGQSYTITPVPVV